MTERTLLLGKHYEKGIISKEAFAGAWRQKHTEIRVIGGLSCIDRDPIQVHWTRRTAEGTTDTEDIIRDYERDN